MRSVSDSHPSPDHQFYSEQMHSMKIGGTDGAAQQHDLPHRSREPAVLGSSGSRREEIVWLGIYVVPPPGICLDVKQKGDPGPRRACATKPRRCLVARVALLRIIQSRVYL